MELKNKYGCEGVGVLMKGSVYRARCLDKVLSQCSSLDVMLGLADVAFDIFLIGLKERNKKKNLTDEEIRHEIEAISEWRKKVSKQKGKNRRYG